MVDAITDGRRNCERMAGRDNKAVVWLVRMSARRTCVKRGRGRVHDVGPWNRRGAEGKEGFRNALEAGLSQEMKLQRKSIVDDGEPE